MLRSYLDIAPGIQAALAQNKGIVALESTIIAHGMPYPRNVETALRVEQDIRDAGAEPATVAILEGRLKAGLSESEIERIGREGSRVAKVSRRDIPYLLTHRGLGATTVASTMIIAHLTGIRVFATGGIGGVHRGGDTTMDISADLQELAQTPVAVVTAGAKAILDLGLTLEYLETFGVPVIGYQTDRFPAFYTRDSGFGLDYRLETPEEIAALLRAKWAIGLRGGVVIANPIAAEHQPDAVLIQRAIEKALADATEQGIKGKAITPFLLSRIEGITGGSSLDANIALVRNNARVAARIACAYTAAL